MSLTHPASLTGAEWRDHFYAEHYQPTAEEEGRRMAETVSVVYGKPTESSTTYIYGVFQDRGEADYAAEVLCAKWYIVNVVDRSVETEEV